MKMKCKLCESENVKIHYKGKIRYGQPGNYLINQCIYQCSNCKVQFYSKSKIDYSKNTYRALIQKNSDEKTYYAAQDKEQLDNISVLGLEMLRGKVIGDIGCGAGSFLDLVKGYTKEQIAVEPFKDYQKILSKKGYKVYDYAFNIDAQYKQRIDIVTSFAVIEHVEDPKLFLNDLKRLVTVDGYILISTPNSDDWLINLLQNDYKSFYYRYVHKWYFNKKSIEYIANELNFKKVEFIYKQKYDISNLLMWLKDKMPTGLGKINTLDELNSSYKGILEKQGLANYLYIKLYV